MTMREAMENRIYLTCQWKALIAASATCIDDGLEPA